MAKTSVSDSNEGAVALRALEAELGEPLLYRTTGRFLGASGLDEVPLQSWGLVALTPTRLVFHHFPNSHPLVMKKDAEVRWEVDRSRFAACEAVTPRFWAKVFSGAVDHVALIGPGVHLWVEVADFPRGLADGWARSHLP